MNIIYNFVQTKNAERRLFIHFIILYSFLVSITLQAFLLCSIIALFIFLNTCGLISLLVKGTYVVLLSVHKRRWCILFMLFTSSSYKMSVLSTCAIISQAFLFHFLRSKGLRDNKPHSVNSIVCFLFEMM